MGLFARIAPTGLVMQVDLLKNGVAQNNLATLTDGSQFEKTVLVSDRLGFKFTQVGSVVAGDKVVLTVYFQKEAISNP